MIGPLLLTATFGVLPPGPLQPTLGNGSTYVISILGSSSDPVCLEMNTINFELPEFLDGIHDEAICIDGTTDSLSIAETRVELQEDGFIAKINGWGEAVGNDIHAAFSRHDIYASMELAAEEDLRVHVSWFVFAAGLGTVNIEIKRLGDIGGPYEPSPPIINRGGTSYIEPISLYGFDVVTMPAGRWRIYMYSTHQAMDTKEGFSHSFARTTHTATYVPLGDVDGNGEVNIIDLLAVLADWGECGNCQSDLDADGQVEIEDLLQILADWTS